MRFVSVEVQRITQACHGVSGSINPCLCEYTASCEAVIFPPTKVCLETRSCSFLPPLFPCSIKRERREGGSEGGRGLKDRKRMRDEGPGRKRMEVKGRQATPVSWLPSGAAGGDFPVEGSCLSSAFLVNFIVSSVRE